MPATGNLTNPRENAPDGRSVIWTIASAMALLAFRPYQGIVHDARLYIGYALSVLHPDTIGQDVLFQQDGQSGWSVYPVVLRWLVDGLGPARGAQLAALIGLLVWFVGYRRFVAAAVDPRPKGARLALYVIAGVALPAFYGPLTIFSVAEPFATPRGVAEGLCLWGLGALIERHRLLAVGALAVAALMHPVMSAPAIAIAVLLSSYEIVVMQRSLLSRRGFGIAVAAIFVAGLLISLGLPRFDDEWRAVLANKHALVFPRYWSLEDYGRVLLHSATLAMGASLFSERTRWLITMVCVLAFGGIALTWLSGDLAGVVVVAQGQAWRALWLMLVVAGLSLIRLLVTVVRADFEATRPAVADLRRAAVALLAAAWVVQEVNARAALLVLLAVLCWWGPTLLSLRLPDGGWRWVVGASLVTALGAVSISSWVSLHVAMSAPDPRMNWSIAYLIASNLPTLVVVALIVRQLSSDRVLTNRGAFMVGVVLLPLVVAASDTRNSYQRELEAQLDDRHRGITPPAVSDGPVAWYYGDLEAWAFAGRPGWGATAQGIPIVFDRELALSWRDRSARLVAAGMFPQAQVGGNMVAPTSFVLDGAALDTLCSTPGGPRMIVVADSSVRGSTETTRVSGLAHTPKLLRPPEIGAPWRRLSRMEVRRCAR